MLCTATGTRRAVATCSIRKAKTPASFIISTSTHFAVFSGNKGKAFTLKARRNLYFTLTRIFPTNVGDG
jgi:hypothetical protein